MSSFGYDYLVVGGGSGGIASAKRAATYGKKVAVIEKARLGGTCVNVGCVPKKIMWNAATMADTMRHDAQQYCFKSPQVEFDWPEMKKKRDAYIVKLNNIYGNGLQNAGVDFHNGNVTFVDAHTISVESSDGTTKNTCTVQYSTSISTAHCTSRNVKCELHFKQKTNGLCLRGCVCCALLPSESLLTNEASHQFTVSALSPSLLSHLLLFYNGSIEHEPIAVAIAVSSSSNS
jgi:hypothetical protein